MPEKKCITKGTMTTPNESEVFKGATHASYFVMKNRDFSASDVEQLELLLCSSTPHK